jgi:nitrite reductase (NADH) large subunit
MKIAIVGCGVAGITAATAVKDRSPIDKVSIYTDENYLYYPRPKLYDLLAGETQPPQILGFPVQWYEKRGIETHLKEKIAEIKVDTKELVLQDGSKTNYDKLLLANGAHPFVPPVKGIEKKGVFSLRSIDDTLAIRNYARGTKRSIVIGGGLLGLEFAWSLRKLGQQVDVVELLPRLLPMQLDQDGAAVLQAIVEHRGIQFTLGVKTQEILGQDKVSGIALDNGKQIEGELALFSAGIRSNVDLAVKSGIKVNRAVVVDNLLQTSASDIYAAGDVVEFEGKVYGIIPAALDQGNIAAANMLGKEKRYYNGTVLSNTLKIVGVDLASIGLVNPEKPVYEEVKKTIAERGIYKKIVLDQGKIVGAIILGDSRSVGPIMSLISQGSDVTLYEDVILEDGFDFRKILSK